MNKDLYTKELYSALYSGIGENYQYTIIQEELSELIQAVAKLQRNNLKQESFGHGEGNIEDIMDVLISEVADVTNVINGLKNHLNINGVVEDQIEYKLLRTAERAKTYIGDIKVE